MARTSVLALAVAGAFSTLAGLAAADVPATQLPTGGSVARGSATIATPDARQMVVDQASDRAIINWDSFSIGADARVTFNQPSASSVVLNRVVGTNPSEIFGRLSANGQVFLSNPNGVLFAPGASVNVGSLFATSLSISDDDFTNGIYQFANAGGAGAVVNGGSIQVLTPGGYAALAGPYVRNDGIVVATKGTAALAAGDRVTLDMVGDGLINVSVDQAAVSALAVNSGTLQADGGRIIMTARSANALLDTVIENTGTIRANRLDLVDGQIVLDGGSVGTVASIGLPETDGTLTITGANVEITDPTINPVPSPLPPITPVFLGPTRLSLLAFTTMNVSAGVFNAAPAVSGLATTGSSLPLLGTSIGSNAFAPQPMAVSIEGAGVSAPAGVTLVP